MTNECIEEQRILNTAEYVENRVAKATEAHLRCKGCDCEYHCGAVDE